METYFLGQYIEDKCIKDRVNVTDLQRRHQRSDVNKLAKHFYCPGKKSLDQSGQDILEPTTENGVTKKKKTGLI